MPTESEVEVVAKYIAQSPMIETPKLDWPSWCGLARAVLMEAELVRAAANPNPPSSATEYDWRRDPMKNFGNGY